MLLSTIRLSECLPSAVCARREDLTWIRHFAGVSSGAVADMEEKIVGMKRRRIAVWAGAGGGIARPSVHFVFPCPLCAHGSAVDCSRHTHADPLARRLWL
jgi:hypothetical protein